MPLLVFAITHMSTPAAFCPSNVLNLNAKEIEKYRLYSEYLRVPVNIGGFINHLFI